MSEIPFYVIKIPANTVPKHSHALWLVAESGRHKGVVLATERKLILVVNWCGRATVGSSNSLLFASLGLLGKIR